MDRQTVEGRMRICFLGYSDAGVQTIENNEPPESAGACLRFFKRKTHAADLLAGKLSYTVRQRSFF